MSICAKELSEISVRVREAGIQLIGESPAFLSLLGSVERVARHSTATVLICGETGTGKELIARAIHYLGERRDFPFVPINCGALPESLAENELFGHRAGAFTGASSEAVGLVRLAHKGTLFLDEVDSLPAKAQVALLRFLQDGRFRPLGAAKEEQANVRIIAASNSRLESDIKSGKFRRDLYYRLNLLALQVPPLRARCGDVHILARHFLEEYEQRYGSANKRIDQRTSVWFDEYSWPGNVRELENLLHREYLLSNDGELHIAVAGNLEERFFDFATGADPEMQLTYKVAKARALEEFDRTYLINLLRYAGGNVTKAARLAGKERRALGKLIKRYRIDHDDDPGKSRSSSLKPPGSFTPTAP